MEIPSKIKIPSNINLPSIIGGPMDYPFTQISLTPPTMPDFQPFMVEIKIPPIEFPPMPVCISGTMCPPISFTFPPLEIKLELEPTTEEKCKTVLQKIVELCNKNEIIGFEKDWGAWTTIITKGANHTHVGTPNGSFEVLVNDLYDLLLKDKGLSWA